MLIKQNPDLRQRISPVLSRKISKTNTEAETDKNFEDTNRPTYFQPLPQPRPGQVAGEGGRTALAAGQKGTSTQREREVFDVVYKNN